MPDSEHTRFSRRHGHAPDAAEITIREDAPADLRYAVVSIPEHDLNVSPGDLRDILCRVLRTRPDPSNWTAYPNVWDEVQRLIAHCPWYKVYDAIEAIHDYFVSRYQRENATRFSHEINECFREMGIGWELVDGRLRARGDDALEATITAATAALSEAQLGTAQGELAAARKALSQRPEPDLSGAIFHAFAALECVARKVCGDEKRTLGQLVNQYQERFPAPLNDAVAKAWGFASEQARHGREGRLLEYADAEACVGLAATLCSYLLAKLDSKKDPDWSW